MKAILLKLMRWLGRFIAAQLIFEDALRQYDHWEADMPLPEEIKTIARQAEADAFHRHFSD